MDTMDDLYINNNAEEEIVISGIAGRFPNSNNLKELQENLFNKKDLGSDNHGRWDSCYNMPHRIGNVNNIEKFDTQFFNISAVEALTIDPGTRMFLEHTYEAIIDAGMNPKELRGTRTGVFTATSFGETLCCFCFSKPQLAGLPWIGCSKSTFAYRISHLLGVTGPSYNIDSACSSSQFAIHEAYRHIRSGDCDAAIVATVNLCLQPNVQFGFHCLEVLHIKC
ncbi:fatty acid synthase-like [Solenopsis invicta]|uniref:fatty acid synthase-like n=1 Tax=Solenopsis invicta TaxID=13686 RepID=UPI00193D7E65|nr:fatty acid synthase-like [Solenopsis invicta]